MARKKHQYFWVIETFSTDSTVKLTGELQRVRVSVANGVKRLVSCNFMFCDFVTDNKRI